MLHVGLDLSRRRLDVCLVDDGGELVMEQLAAANENVLQSAVPAAADVERMGSLRRPIAEFAPSGRAALAYEALWREVRERL